MTFAEWLLGGGLQLQPCPWCGGPRGGGNASGLGFLWMLLWLSVLIALIAGLYYLFTQKSSLGLLSTEPDSALEILRERYARGELTDEEFEERSTKLREGAGLSKNPRARE